jgi:P27 family predicted phage terminase small subunit
VPEQRSPYKQNTRRTRGTKVVPSGELVLPRDVEVVTARQAPEAPGHLGPKGQQAWHAVMSWLPLMVEDLDALSVERLAELADQRAALADRLAADGPLLSEPIVTPRGDVVGQRLVPHPALAALRAIDRASDEISDRLGLTPAARKRLDITLTSADRMRLEAEAVMTSMFEKKKAI